MSLRIHEPRLALHQVIVGAMPGDAITDEALLIRGWIREMGLASEIFAESFHPGLADEIHPFASYRPQPGEQRLVYHHSIGTQMVDQLMRLPVRLILIYHNITPAAFFEDIDSSLARQLTTGREQLQVLGDCTEVALADSSYNEQELRAAGFERTGILPITLNQHNYDLPLNNDLLTRYKDGGPSLLFVGRLVPNKRQQDLIMLLYHYHRIAPTARLFLVGEPWVPAYTERLRELAARLGIYDSVFFIGHVSQQDLVTFYHLADAYVSMSEHEGFGKPLVESMYLGLPVLAYAAAAVPGTLGDTGILFHQKHYTVIAEALDLSIHVPSFRQRLIAAQRERAKLFFESSVKKIWQEQMRQAMGTAARDERGKDWN